MKSAPEATGTEVSCDRTRPAWTLPKGGALRFGLGDGGVRNGAAPAAGREDVQQQLGEAAVLD